MSVASLVALGLSGSAALLSPIAAKLFGFPYGLTEWS